MRNWKRLWQNRSDSGGSWGTAPRLLAGPQATGSQTLSVGWAGPRWQAHGLSHCTVITVTTFTSGLMLDHWPPELLRCVQDHRRQPDRGIIESWPGLCKWQVREELAIVRAVLPLDCDDIFTSCTFMVRMVRLSLGMRCWSIFEEGKPDTSTQMIRSAASIE